MVGIDHNCRSERSYATETTSRDRGQVILIGAITLAFIVLGIVVVFNGILYTDGLSSGASSQSATDTNTVEYELADGVGGIAHYGNTEGGWDDNYETNLADYINEVAEFGDQYRNTKANSHPVVVDISYNEVSKGATAIVGDIESGSVELEEEPVGHFELDLEHNSDESEITVSVDGGSSVTIKESSNGEYFTIDGAECDIEGENVRFDLLEGSVDVESDECSSDDLEELSIIDPGESYEEIDINADEEMEGTFELLVKGDDTLDSDDFSNDIREGAWSVKIDVTYDSNDVSYKRTQTVNVYGGNE